MIILFSSEILNCISPRDENINIISGQRECNIFLDFTGKFNHSCYVILLTIISLIIKITVHTNGEIEVHTNGELAVHTNCEIQVHTNG